MPRSRMRASRLSTVLSASVCLTLALGSRAAMAEGPEPEPTPEGPSPKPAQDPEPPPPNLAPTLVPHEDESGNESENENENENEQPSPGIEFAVPPPDDEDEDEDQDPVESPEDAERRRVIATFPDPGMAPNDGNGLLTLGGTTIGLTALGLTAGVLVGLQRGADLEWLLPATIVPGVGLLAFGGGSLFVGIKRARSYRRWEIGSRVVGLPQGGGLKVGASFTTLGALGFVSYGIVMLGKQPQWGAAMLAVGAASAVATPIMFVVGARNQRRVERTGGWKRKPLPPLPPSATGQLELHPLIMPIRGGMIMGASGRF